MARHVCTVDGKAYMYELQTEVTPVRSHSHSLHSAPTTVWMEIKAAAGKAGRAAEDRPKRAEIIGRYNCAAGMETMDDKVGNNK